jgi:hypothetical protein
MMRRRWGMTTTSKLTQIRNIAQQRREQYLKQKPHLKEVQGEIDKLLRKSGSERLKVCNLLFESRLADLMAMLQKRI